MNAATWKAANRIAMGAADLKGVQLDRHLEDSCAGDKGLESAVRDLLTSLDECPPGFLAPEDPGTDAAYALAPGQTVSHFELLRELGSGGAGVVFEAQDLLVDRRVALKVQVLQPFSKRAGRTEADMAGRVEHPGVVRVYSQGRDGPWRWIAMELVEGSDLGDELARLEGGEPGVRLPARGERGFVRACAELAALVGDALDAAGQAGVIHRDVKPGNVLLRESGEPLLADFGLAKPLDGPAASQSGAVMGTVHYMSPEQGRGEVIDVRTDVYSLGAVLYHLITGRAPYPGESVAGVLSALTRGPAPTMRQVAGSIPAELDAVVAKAMSYAREERYADVGSFVMDLRRWMQGEPVKARPTGALYHGHLWLRRHRIAVAVACAALLTGIGLWQVASVREGRARSKGAADRAVAQADRALDKGDLSELATAAGLLEQLAGEGAGPRVGPSRRRIAEVGRAVVDGAESEIEEALHREDLVSTDDRAVIDAASRIAIARPLIGREPSSPSTREIERWFPRLRVAPGVDATELRLHPLDGATGQYRLQPSGIFPAPDGELAVAPGQYRIVVAGPGGRFAELSRWVGEWGEIYDLGDVRLARPGEVNADMVMFEAGESEIRLPFTDGQGPPWRAAQYRAFWIDRYEVSNGQYMEFLGATGDDPSLQPFGWLKGDRPPGWDALPVVCVSWRQARAYAEWAGKRLPTDAEWNRACLGEEKRPYPWGDTSPLATTFAGPDGSDDAHGRYLSRVLPVTTVTKDVTPEGILHMAGNVSEWSDSVALGVIDGRLHALPTHRISKGWSWEKRSPYDLASGSQFQISSPYRAPIRGFRCAKSASLD